MRRQRLQSAALAFVLVAALEPCVGGDLALRWSVDPANPKGAVVEFSGLDAAAAAKLDRELTTPAQWQTILTVRAEPDKLTADSILPAMAGSYRVDSGKVRFTPLFPLAAGVNYVAVLNSAQISGHSGAPLSARHRIPPSEASAATVVTHIYPSAAILPENLLKFYVHFSAPMSKGGIYQHIQLLDAGGKAVELPFLELDEELWNPAMTRLTLFIDPGRIKRGVRPLEEIGPALVAGERFRLLVDRSCRDAAGRPLAAGFEKVFSAGPPEREAIDPGKWKIKIPAADTRDPLFVDFLKPLDHAITPRVLRVVAATGGAVSGAADLENEERTWKFVPAVVWSEANYQIVIPTAIEDLAGNNIGKAFDVDLAESTESEPSAARSVRLPFQVK